METSKQKTGRIGEEAACRYLTRLGHMIVDRNWRTSHLETDIITMDRAGLHFVEVKTRKAPAIAEPERNVGPLKQKRLVRAASAYLNDNQIKWIDAQEVFFDVISVLICPDGPQINYYPQAFIPTYYQ